MAEVVVMDRDVLIVAVLIAKVAAFCIPVDATSWITRGFDSY